MSQVLDSAYISNLIGRLGKHSAGAEAQWGSMRADQLIPHLIAAIESSMGRHPTELPFKGNWITRKIVYPLAAAGMLPVPKNLKLKSNSGTLIPLLVSPGGAEELRAIATEFVAGAAAGTLRTTWHPLFGDIGAKGWLRIHRMHCEHHMKQFGL